MALKDLTGGDPQVVDLNDPQVRDECANGFLWQKLKLWMKQVGPLGPRCPQPLRRQTHTVPSRAALMARRAQGSLCGCCYSLPRGQKREVAFDGGIIRGHAYGIIDVREHKDLRFLQAPRRPSTAAPTPMRTRRARWGRGWVLRARTAAGQVRNPWGMKEWCGPWADYAPEWQNLDADAPQWMRSTPSSPGAGGRARVLTGGGGGAQGLRPGQRWDVLDALRGLVQVRAPARRPAYWAGGRRPGRGAQVLQYAVRVHTVPVLVVGGACEGPMGRRNQLGRLPGEEE